MKPWLNKEWKEKRRRRVLESWRSQLVVERPTALSENRSSGRKCISLHETPFSSRSCQSLKANLLERSILFPLDRAEAGASWVPVSAFGAVAVVGLVKLKTYTLSKRPRMEKGNVIRPTVFDGTTDGKGWLEGLTGVEQLQAGKLGWKSWPSAP